MDRAAVVERIESAWAPQPQPTKIAYDDTGHHLECLAVAKFFGGKTWNEVSWPVLSTYQGDRSSCLCFMSPEAFRYFLSSYMLIAVNDYSAADVTGDSAWLSLELGERAVGFTPSQDAAIRTFVAYMSRTHQGSPTYTRASVLSRWGVAPVACQATLVGRRCRGLVES